MPNETKSQATHRGDFERSIELAGVALDDLYESFEREQAERIEERQELIRRFNGLREGLPGLPKFDTTDMERRGFTYLTTHVSDMIMSCPDQSSIDGMRAFMALAAKIFQG